MPGSWCYINVFRFLFGSHTFFACCMSTVYPAANELRFLLGVYV